MKKMILGLAALILSTALWAKDVKVNQDVLNAFKKAYSDVNQVKWEKSGELYLASFTDANNQQRVTYFNEAGELVSSTRTIPIEQLPLRVSEEINTRFEKPDMDFTAMEVAMQNETFYLLNIRDAKRKYLIKAYDNGEVSVIRKEKIR